MATRRNVLTSVAAGLGVMACRAAIGQPAERAAYVAVETSAATGLSRARFLSGGGVDTGAVPLDFRAHGFARHGRTLTVFPRRPGNRFALMDLGTLEIRAVVAAPEGRHFYGHGAFSLDGRTLLTTENDLGTLGGALGVYEIGAGIRRAGTIPLPLPGPHDIHRAADEDRFHVALGGLMTHPGYGRTPLNLDSFVSELVSVDLGGGDPEPLGRWAGTDRISLRHLAADGRGRLYVGGQVPKGVSDRPDQVLWLVEQGRARPVAAGARLGGYVSSVAAHGDEALVTSKESGVALRLDGDRVLGAQRLGGASAAGIGHGIRAVSGFAALAINGAGVNVSGGHEFDNHGHALV